MAGKKRITLRYPLHKNQSPFFFTWSLQPGVRGDISSQLQFFSLLIGYFLIIFGSVVIVGWHIQNKLLVQFSPYLPTVKPNAAIAFLFSGITLVLAYNLQPARWTKILRDISALIVYLIGSLTLFEFVFMKNLGIDQMFYADIFSKRVVAFPNRMTELTAVMFTLSGLALFLLNRRIKGRYISQYLGLVTSILLLPTLIPYIYHVYFLYGFGTGARIAPHTAIALLVLNIGIIFARPMYGFMRLIISRSAGGYVTRRLLFATIFGPFVLSYFILLGSQAKLYDTEYRYLLFTITCIVYFTYLIWRTAQALHRIDIQKRQSEGNLQFLSEAGKVLAQSINYKYTLQALSEIAVSYMCDYCLIDIFNDKQILKRFVVASKTDKKNLHINKVNKIWFSQQRFTHEVDTILQSKKSILYPTITQDILKRYANSKKELQQVTNLGISSLMMVPILVKKKVIGIIYFVATDSQREYTNADVATASELASRASLAIENAQLFNDVNRALHLRDEFISIVSHELKTPVTALKVYAQIMKKELHKAKSPQIHYVEKIETQVDKVTILIQDLLDIAKVQAGKLSFTFSEFMIMPLVREIVEDLQAITPNHKISVIGETNKTVKGDRERIGQILINLLTNAIKYSPHADKIVITISEEKQRVKISVRDFGIGIDKNHLAKIFDRFYQIRDGKKQFSGLGMGLYIAREIAIRHEGDLEVESTKGKGSIFTFSIPFN